MLCFTKKRINSWKKVHGTEYALRTKFSSVYPMKSAIIDPNIEVTHRKIAQANCVEKQEAIVEFKYRTEGGIYRRFQQK